MCGIVGVISKSPVNQLIYDALLLLQHRGQDAAGIVTMQGTKCFMHKARGMVRGALILVVAATVVTLVPAAANSTAWKASHGALWLGMALEGLKPVLPQSLNVHIHT